MNDRSIYSPGARLISHAVHRNQEAVVMDIDDEIERLKVALSQCEKERNEAQAKCAEMRSVLSVVERLAPGYDWNADPSKLTLLIGRCFADCGNGWKSPEEWAALAAECAEMRAVILDVVQRSNEMDPALNILLNWLDGHKEAK